MPLPELPETPPSASAIVIEFGPVSRPSGVRWSTVWRQPGERPWAQTARDGEAFYISVAEFADFCITGSTVMVAASPSARESTIRHLLLDQVLPLALAAEGHLVLHAAAVHRDAVGTIALAGTAGSGKSTLAAALRNEGWTVVSDDGVVVDRSGDTPIAIGAYPGLRVWPDAALATGLSSQAITDVAEYSAKVRVSSHEIHQPAPLRSVYVIEPGGDCRVERLSARDAAIRTIAHAYRADPDDRTALAAQLEAAADLGSRVGIFRLFVPRDLTRLSQAARVVSRHATFGAP